MPQCYREIKMELPVNAIGFAYQLKLYSFTPSLFTNALARRKEIGHRMCINKHKWNREKGIAIVKENCTLAHS